MSNVRISQLNSLSTITSDDFVPIVDSASMTTYRVPLQQVLTFIADSGSVISASWSSQSYNSSTSAFSEQYKKCVSFTAPVSTVINNAVKMCNVVTDTQHSNTWLASLNVYGLHTSCAKMYLITTQITSPGFDGGIGPAPYSGWYTVKPLVASHEYLHSNNVYTDYDLEMSRSTYDYTDSFRIRTTKCVDPFSTNGTANLTFLTLGNVFNETWSVETGEVASSNSLPAWDSSFVTMQNYMVSVSGSMKVTNGITASLQGTSSWAISASWAAASLTSVSASYSLSSSHAQKSISSSFSNTSSYSVSSSWANTSSYAISSSHSQKSISSSYANTASFVSGRTGPIFISNVDIYVSSTVGPHTATRNISSYVPANATSIIVFVEAATYLTSFVAYVNINGYHTLTTTAVAIGVGIGAQAIIPLTTGTTITIVEDVYSNVIITLQGYFV